MADGCKLGVVSLQGGHHASAAKRRDGRSGLATAGTAVATSETNVPTHGAFMLHLGPRRHARSEPNEPICIDELRIRAQEKVTRRELPPPDQHSGLGRAGSGQHCCVCGRDIPKYRIEKPSTEYAVQWQKAERVEVLRFHPDCFRAWVSLSALPRTP